MASVVERSSRIQGPFEESDFEHQRMSPGKYTDQNKVMFAGDMRVESGTCNVCSAPCSSCMHRRAVAMETSVDCGSSDTTFQRKEGDFCSFNGANHRSRSELQTAASETSNLLSGSSNDSSCANSESKATLRECFTCDNSEVVDMLPEVSTVKTIKEATFSGKRTSDVGFEMSCTYPKVMQDSEFDEGHRVSTCHKNNDSCTSEPTYGNMLDLVLDKRDTPCSSLSTPKCSTKETEMTIQVEKVTHESLVCLTEANMINSAKLNGFLREPFVKKSPGLNNINFSTKSDLSNPSSRKNILSKLKSPSLSNHISSENTEDSIDLDATRPSNFQSAYHECLVVNDEASARDLLSTDNEVSKEAHITSGAPSTEFNNEERCAISATDFGRTECSLHASETQLQPILDGRASELDNMLYDVKVCDICGDAGREELLATCSRCIDGAEHTYCMRIMLDKMPEGDWLCEECQLKEKVATRKLNEAEPKFGTSNVPSLNKKIQNLGNFTNIESSRKLVVGSSVPETSASIIEMESPKIISKRHVDQVDDSSTARKKVPESKYESTKLATSKVDTVFSRVGSSRNLHVPETKGSSAASSSESRRTNVSPTFSCSLKLDSRGNAFKNLYVAETTRSSKNSSPVGQSSNSWTLSRTPSGSLSRQISFRKNFEPKVKKLVEGVPQNLAKDSTSKDKKMLVVARRKLSKSASFNSLSSEHQNIGAIIKAQSFKSRPEDPIVLKPIKERNISFVSSVYPDVVQSPNKRMHLPKLDSKTAVPTRDLNNKFESNTLSGGRSENNSGYNETKRQSSFKYERHGIYDSEDKRAGDRVKNKATQADSGGTDTSYKEVGEVTNNLSLADYSLQVQIDDKVLVTSSPGASRASNSGINPVLVHDKLKETIHSSQCCEIDRLASTAAKPSAVVSLVEGTRKKNKWKDAAKAAMLERKRSGTVDQSESMSNNIIYGGPSRSTSTNSSCLKNLPLVGVGAPCGKEVVGDSYTDYSKTDGTDVQQIKHSMESSFAVVSLVEGTRKKNKWKDTAKAAMIEKKRSGTVDQSESMSNNIIYEGPSISTLTNSSCLKNLPLAGVGAPCGKEVVGDSYTDYSKTDGTDVQQIKHSMESSYVPAVMDLNADPNSIDDSIEKSTIPILSDHSSPFTTSCRALAIPEHEFIWQGAFELLRIGRLPETVDGIQAHLSNVSSPKVHELACQFPCKIQLEEVPRVSVWPLQFQDSGPAENDIALYFFAKDAESYEKSYQKLLEAAINNDLALKGNINEIELFIFPSSMLPASSQRWNMLFFLWGIFRLRKSDSPIPCASLQERPCGTKTKLLDQDKSPSPACELSTFQQPNSQRYPPKEVCRSNGSCGANGMKYDSSVDFHAVSSNSPEENIHKVEDLHYKPVAEVDTTDLSVDSSHSCSKSYSFDQKERFSAEEIYETKQGNKNTEFDLARVTHINANDQHKLRKSSPGCSSASCFREDEKIKKGRLVKIEAESEVKLTDGVCPRWGSGPNRKRAFSCSETISGEVSESTKVIMWQQKESCLVSTEDDRDHKRMNRNSEGPASNHFRDASMERNFPSPTRYPYEQRNDGVNYNNVIESTKCPERCFFPVDSHRVGSEAVENFRFFLPPVNEYSPDSSIPDLELGLGGKMSLSKKQTVPLFSPSVDRGKVDKLSGSIFDDDDMSEALSLSLAFPSVDRKRTDDTEQKDPPTVNTHLFLFGGFTDG